MSVNDVNVYFGGLFYSGFFFFIKLEMSTSFIIYSDIAWI